MKMLSYLFAATLLSGSTALADLGNIQRQMRQFGNVLTGTFSMPGSNQQVSSGIIDRTSCELLRGQASRIVSSQWRFAGCDLSSLIYKRAIAIQFASPMRQVGASSTAQIIWFYPNDPITPNFERLVQPTSNASGNNACDPL